MGGAHVLVVDDDGYFRNTVADALGGLGYRISRAEDVPMALGVLRSEVVDVVVADHVMPGLSGLARLAAMDQASVFRFIEKPFDPVSVRFAICSAARASAEGGHAAVERREACSA